MGREKARVTRDVPFAVTRCSHEVTFRYTRVCPVTPPSAHDVDDATHDEQRENERIHTGVRTATGKQDNSHCYIAQSSLTT